MKLWQKDHTSTSALVEAFTVGNDKLFDVLLARYDVLGSLAHTKMLHKVGLLEAEDLAKIEAGLNELLAEIEAGKFSIDEDIEDVHSQVEFLLTKRIGEAGKKIHSCRSRNDKVAVDIKLYLRDKVNDIREQVQSLFNVLIQLSEQYKDKLLPGYTHLQIAMPSSFGLWFGAYAESLVDDMEMLAAANAVVNKNPLGSGAGYGSSFPLDRKMTTELLHFATLDHNAVYAQMTRGKTEKVVAMALSCIAATLSRMSMDVCLYINQNFGFIQFPESLTTGSSIMPHKKNPDVFELVRGKCNRIQAAPNELTLLVNNLPSGYQRDLQLTKEIIFPTIENLSSCLDILIFALPQIQVKDNILEDEKYKYLFSVEAVNKLVNNGVPFRDAYKQVGNDIEKGSFQYKGFKAQEHTHEGSMGNLCNEAIKTEMRKVLQKFEH
ncbi:MAG: argininosuccinate lyase [Flavipsychrobacter sp.]